jgi:hypothetical protein
MAVADVATALRTDPDAVDRHYHAAIRTLRRHFSCATEEPNQSIVK